MTVSFLRASRPCHVHESGFSCDVGAVREHAVTAGNAMWQLNLAMSEEEAIQIVDLYDTSGKGEMRYEQLVKDVCAGVPGGVLEFEKKTTMHHRSSRRPRGDASRSRETAAGPPLHQTI